MARPNDDKSKGNDTGGTDEARDADKDMQTLKNESENRTATIGDVSERGAHSEERRKLTKVHEKKRRKNLTLLALIFGWIVLIWMITMVRIAQAQDMERMYMNQRTTHSAKIEKADKSYQERGTQFSRETDARRSRIDKQVKAHNKEIKKADVTYEKRGGEFRGEMGESLKKINKQRVAHKDEIERNPEKWWEGWRDRLYPEDYTSGEADAH